MRKLVLLLTIATLSLAITCGYLYQQLRVERSRVSAGVRTDHAVETEDSVDDAGLEDDGSLPSGDADEDGETAFPAPVRDSIRETSGSADARARRLAQRREQLQQRWADPQFRARALVRSTYEARRRNPDLGAALRLSSAQEGAFVDLLARQALQIDELQESRRFASESERASIDQEIGALRVQHEQERAAQLGGAGYQAYQDYTRQIPERQQIRELRLRLDESSAMTPAQSSQLIAAMYAERDSYLQQMKTVEGFGGYAPRYPFEAMTNSRDQAARVRFAQEQVARTEAFMSRLRLRASGVLNAEQLRRFDEIQEEQLSMVQARVERIRNQGNRPRGRR
jgi:hypothetical protein